jgi:hypothetical protein
MYIQIQNFANLTWKKMDFRNADYTDKKSFMRDRKIPSQTNQVMTKDPNFTHEPKSEENCLPIEQDTAGTPPGPCLTQILSKLQKNVIFRFS